MVHRSHPEMNIYVFFLKNHQEGAQEELWPGQLQPGCDRIKRNVGTGVGEWRGSYRVPVNEGTVVV